MKAALGIAMPAPAQTHEANARLRRSAPSDETGFRDALDGRKAMQDGRQPGDTPPKGAEGPRHFPARWSLPHAIGQAAQRATMPRDGTGRQDGEESRIDLDPAATTTVPDVAAPSPRDAGDAGLPGAQAEQSAGEPDEPGDETVRANPAAIDKAAAPAALGAPSGDRPEVPDRPAPPASDRARQHAAPASMLNRENGEADGDVVDASPHKERAGAEKAGKAEPAAGAGRPEARPAPAPMDGSARDGQAEIRVVSIQRAPAPAFPAEQAAAAGQKSATAETRPTQLPAQSDAGRVLQTLKIQLHPAELGPVTARLRLVAEQLMVDIQVETAEARHRLGSDGDAIVKALRGLGYDIDRVTIQQSAQSASGNSAGAGGPRDGAFQSAGGGQGGEQSRGAGQDPRQDRHGTDRRPAQEAGDAPHGDLYI